MANFKIRKTADGIKGNPNYTSYSAEGNGSGNPFYPEATPKAMGGTMTDTSMSNKDTLGNCTWFAIGRFMEVHGVRPVSPHMRGNASVWGTNGETLSSGPEVGGVVVFGDGGYGHVAFIEAIVNGVVYLSESAYSTRGNDFLFKYGRTIEDVKNAWGMTVLRYIAPASPSTSYDDAPKPKPTPEPAPVVDRTGDLLVIYPEYLLGDKQVIVTDANGNQIGEAIRADLDGRVRKYKISKQLRDGFYQVTQYRESDPLGGSGLHIEWRPGIGFEKL